MKQSSAGLVMYRLSAGEVEVFLVHPGGPFWAKKDLGTWSIPKGLIEEDEEKLEAAKREFKEETSVFPSGPFLDLGEVRLKSGKRVFAWAFAGDFDLSQLKSNTFSLEWPPKSGQFKEFPEIDRGEFFSLSVAHAKINPQQKGLLDRLEAALAP